MNSKLFYGGVLACVKEKSFLKVVNIQSNSENLALNRVTCHDGMRIIICCILIFSQISSYATEDTWRILQYELEIVKKNTYHCEYLVVKSDFHACTSVVLKLSINSSSELVDKMLVIPEAYIAVILRSITVIIVI